MDVGLVEGEPGGFWRLQRSGSSQPGCVSKSGVGMWSKWWLLALGVKLEWGNLM